MIDKHPKLSLESAAVRLTNLDKKGVYLANLAAYHANRQGHHLDISFGFGFGFGFGYCTVRFTTHDINGLSGTDFDRAAALDQLFG